MIRFIPLGGAGEVGAACFYLYWNGTGIVLDCGMHPRKQGFEALPELDTIRELPVDFAFISHAHHDHIGSLPFLVKRHPYVQVYATRATRDIASYTLHDTVSILKEQATEEQLSAMYSHEVIDLLTESINIQEYDAVFPATGIRHRGADITATFLDAGHVLGSAGVLLESSGQRIYYTGDISTKPQFLLPGAQVPRGHVNTLILECTLGATPLETVPGWRDELKRFTSSANDVLARGGCILVPVFSLGKMQEMLAMIWHQMERGRLSRVPIYTGGLGEKISALYDTHRYIVPRNDPDYELKEIPTLRLHDIERVERIFDDACIILVSSGMMIEGTASYHIGKMLLGRHDCGIFTVGYMDPGSPGYAVANAQRGTMVYLTPHAEPVPIRCSIERFRFTAHATREGLLEVVEHSRPEQVILVHGDEVAIDAIGEAILTMFPRTRVFGARVGSAIEIG